MLFMSSEGVTQATNSSHKRGRTKHSQQTKGHCVEFQQLFEIEETQSRTNIHVSGRSKRKTFSQSCANLTQHCSYIVIFFIFLCLTMQTKQEVAQEEGLSQLNVVGPRPEVGSVPEIIVKVLSS